MNNYKQFEKQIFKIIFIQSTPISRIFTVLLLFLSSTFIPFYWLIFCLFYFQYAQETQHEKILRGLAVGIAFTMYARLEEADPLVTSLTTDKDPVLRRSGMYTLAMAYCGTGSNKAIRKLLHIAVSIGKIDHQKHSPN